MFEGFFRSLVVTLCGWIYPLIPKLYSVFYSLASAKFFDESVLRTLANNIYILVSVVMLFVLAIQLIKTIVNPDLFDDKNKGLASIFKRMVIALILIVLIPIGFNQVYHYQNEILNNNLIEKVIVGYSGSDSMGESNAGQVLAASTIVDLLQPNDGAQVEEGSSIIDEYKLMISTDIKYIKSVGKHINDKYSPTGDEDASDDEKEYVFKFEPLIALAAGCAVVYFLFIFSMDMAVRMLKLSLFELTAPVTVIAYIYGGDEQLKRWWKEVSAIYVEVFVKVAIIAFIIFAMNNLDTFGSTITGDYLWLIKLLVLIGLFTLAGQLPDLVKSLFGVTYTPKGGIGGRLGKMAGPVGKLAQDSWNKVKKGAATVAGAGALGLAAVANPALGAGMLAAGGAVAGGKKLWNDKLKNTNAGRHISAFGKTAGAFLGAGNPISGASAASKAYKESDLGKSKQVIKDQQRKQNLSNSAKANASAAANVNYAGLFDNKNKIDTTTFAGITDDFATMRKNIMEESKVPKAGQDVVKNYVDKKHEKAVADNDMNKYNQMVSSIERLKSTSKNEAASRQFETLLSQINAGGTGTDVASITNSVKAALRSDGYTDPNAVDAIASTIENYAKNISDLATAGGTLRTQQEYIDTQTNKSTAFSTAESNYNAYKDSLDEKTQANVSQVVSSMNQISKEKVKNNQR